MSIRTQARNIALSHLERLRNESVRPYDFRSVHDDVVKELDAILLEHDETRRAAVDELVSAALRDADRVMLRGRAEATISARVGQLPLIISYDPLQPIALGEGERIAWGKARAEDLERNLRVETENIIAQQAAYAEKYRGRQAQRDALLPLDPRTTTDEIMRPADEQEAA